jgi:hypothetical protein
VPNCSGGLIRHVDGTAAGCTLDDGIDGCEGLEERHGDASETCWKSADGAATGAGSSSKEFAARPLQDGQYALLEVVRRVIAVWRKFEDAEGAAR